MRFRQATLSGQAVAPVLGDSGGRARDALIEWVMGWRCQVRSVEKSGAGIVVEPGFARFERTDDGVAGGSGVSGGVLGR